MEISWRFPAAAAAMAADHLPSGLMPAMRLEPVKHFVQPNISPRIRGWLANISQKPRASRLKENRAVIRCTVRNLARTGACLAVEGPIGIPDAFSPVFDSAEQFRACSVLWRRQNASGP
jgi:hypothetical protein